MKDINSADASAGSRDLKYNIKESLRLFGQPGVSMTLDFKIDEFRTEGAMADAMSRLSVSGVQEKFPAVVESGKIRIVNAGEQSTHILKPAPWDKTLIERKQLPINEYITMQIAERVYGIETAANGLCFTPDGQVVYVTRRFDIMPDGRKVPMEDFASLIGANEQLSGTRFKYEGSYEDIANVIRRYVAAWMVDMERFFTLLVFNYIYGNSDAHLKNFSLIRKGEDYRLSPAYDLLNTALHVNGGDVALERGLSPHIEKSDYCYRTGHLCRADFARFGERIGLKEIRTNSILDRYMSIPDKVGEIVNQSRLSEKMKRSYLRIVNERMSRFKHNE